jgi:hypothetical protein
MRFSVSENTGRVGGPTPLAKGKALVLLGLPFVLFLTTMAVFLSSAHLLGKEKGYLLGLLFYWLFWCLLVPRFLLGKASFSGVLVGRVPLFARMNWPAVLLFAIVTGAAAIMYLSKFVRAPWILILLAVPCATADGVCEEILWRGLYIRSFPDNPLLAILYPSLGYAAWHFVPQMIFPATGGTLPFVVSTFFLGLAYGFIAYRTASAKWTAISHSLNGALALSGNVAKSLLSII